MKKRFLVVVLAVLMLCTGVLFAGCGDKDTTPNTPTPNNPSTNNPSPNTPTPNTPSPNTPTPNTPSPNTPTPNTPSPNTPTESKQTKYKKLTDAIIKNGTIDSEDDCYFILVSREEGVTVTILYYWRDNSVRLVTGYNGSDSFIYIDINPQLSGRYEWGFKYSDYYSYFTLGGTCYASRATSDDYSRAFVENPGLRTGLVTSSTVSSAMDLVSSMGGLAITGLRMFLVLKTDLKISDFGFTQFEF